MTKPPCTVCKSQILKGPAYSTPEGYLCESHWTQAMKEAEEERK